MFIIKILVRLFAYLFHFALSLGLAALGFAGWVSGARNFEIPLLPSWHGTQLIHVLFWGGIAGILITWFAIRKKLKILFTLWATVVLCYIVWGYFFTNYNFGGMEPFRESLWFTAFAVLAWFGAVNQLFRRR